MKWSLSNLLAAATLLQTTALAAPTTNDSKLKVVKTTTTPDGQVLDWVIPESQGTLATPPSSPPNTIKHGASRVATEALLPQGKAFQGPAGTVPILRTSNTKDIAQKRLPEASDNEVGGANSTHIEDGYAGQHWYSSTAQGVNNNGGLASVSLFSPYVESGGDFSLLQTAVIHNGANGYRQTVEAGWIVYPNQVAQPHLFSFFTTNNYGNGGDNVGGWNRDQAGWVQVDSSIYPGIPFAPLSSDGGAQYEMQVGYQLVNGNWWLWCLDRFIGYYPASLFGGGDTLGGGSNQINWYGEIYNSNNGLTTTDMGSGEFSGGGFGKSAYMHNIVYYDAGLAAYNYDGSSQLITSDTGRYDIAPTWNSGGSWGSFFYLGGPGAGGRIGG